METSEDVKNADLAASAALALFRQKDKKFTWEKFKDYSIRFFGGLFMERKGGKWAISVGRVSWWMAFVPALYIWVDSLGKQDITPHHITVLLLLAGYNFGKKIVDKMQDKNGESEGPG